MKLKSLIIIALLPIILMFRPGLNESGDMSIHVTKLMEFYQNLNEGNFIPQWAGRLNANYGYPLFVFSYLSPYYIASIFKVLGFGYILSIKLMVSTTFVSSGILMYWWAKKQQSSNIAGFCCGIFYLFMPYHLVDLNFRMSVGELVAFVFLPLVLIGIQRKLWFISALSFWLLILSHQTVALAALPFFIWYAGKQLFSLLFGIIFATHYWLPILVENKYIYQSIAAVPLTFQTIKDLIYAPWGWGLLFQGHFGELSFLLGYSQWLVIMFALIFQKDNFLKGLLIWFFIYLFMILDISKPIWYFLPLLSNFQFSYRLLTIQTLIVSMIAGIILPKLNYKLRNFILIFTVLYTFVNWTTRRMISDIGDAQVLQHLPYLTAQTAGEIFWAPISRPYWMKEVTSNTFPESTTILRTSTHHIYQFENKSDLDVQDNTYYFPGWIGKIDGKELEITHSNGLINFKVPKGNHEVEIYFTRTPIRNFSLLVTQIILIFMCLWSVLKKITIRFTPSQQ